MIMVIGGAYQGKEAFAKEKLCLQGDPADGKSCDYDELFSCSAVKNFHLFVQRYLEDDRLDQLAEHLGQSNPNLVVITDEIGYGIVPLEKRDRLWREKTGRICCQLAQRSDEVYRMVAGIPVKIKGQQ